MRSVALVVLLGTALAGPPDLTLTPGQSAVVVLDSTGKVQQVIRFGGSVIPAPERKKDEPGTKACPCSCPCCQGKCPCTQPAPATPPGTPPATPPATIPTTPAIPPAASDGKYGGQQKAMRLCWGMSADDKKFCGAVATNLRAVAVQIESGELTTGEAITAAIRSKNQATFGGSTVSESWYAWFMGVKTFTDDLFNSKKIVAVSDYAILFREFASGLDNFTPASFDGWRAARR